jgi:hypothetical protein
MAGIDIHTVDSIIRQKAQSRLKQEIEALSKPLRDRIAAGHGALDLPRFTDAQGRRTTARAALDEVESALYQAEVRRYEDAAVKAFVDRHDALQSALDDLKVEASLENDTHIHVHARPRERLKGE